MIIKNKRDTLFWKALEYTIYLFFVLFPFLSYKSFLYSGTSSRSVNLIFISSIFAIAFVIWIFRKGNSIPLPKSPVLLSIIIYGVFLGVSSIFGMSFYTSFWSVATRTTGLWYLVSLFFLIYIFWAIFHDRNKQDKVILCIIFSTALYSVLSFLSPEGIGLLFSGYKADAFTFGNSTFAGMYIFGAFILSLYYLFQSEKKKWWMYVLPIIIIINPNIVSSSLGIGEARASSYVILLSIPFLFVIWLISKIKDKKTLSVTTHSIFGFSVIMMIICVVSLLSPKGYLRETYLSQATSARPLVWEMSEKVIAEKPYLGWGIDNFERVFEIHYDNRLLQNEYGNEAWFDRAHNIFIDQLVDNGFIGLISYISIYLVVILCLIYTCLNSIEKKDRIFSSILIVYFTMHILELQTAFDTSISYPMLAIMVAFSAILFDRTRSQITKNDNEWSMGGWVKYVIGVSTLIFFGWTFIAGWVPFVRAQIKNGYIRTIGSAEKRIQVYDILLGSTIDKHSFLWRTSTDFQRGIGENPKVLEDPNKVAFLKKEIAVFEDEYRKYVEDNPNHFRARLNLADVLIYQRLLGVDKLKEAQEVLDGAIDMVPQAPQSYWMKAVAYIYMRKFDLAREYAKKGLDLNPNIKQSQAVVNYVEKSIKDWPEIDLFFFRQI